MRARVLFSLLLTAVFVISGCSANSAEGEPRKLVFAGFGGTFESTMREDIIPLFEEEFDAEVEYVSGVAAANFAKVQAAGGNSGLDVVWTNDLTHLRGKDEDLWASLDPEIVDNLDDVKELAQDPDGIGVGQGINAFVLEYNREIYEENGLDAPDSWLDLWAPEVEGKALLFDIGVSQSQFFIPILAEILGKDQSAVDIAFERLSQLGSTVASFPANAAEADQLFLQKAGWITLNNMARVQELKKSGFPVEGVYPEEGGILFLNYLDIVKGSENEELAQEFVNFMLGQEAQELNATQMSQGPVNVNVTLDPEVAATVPYDAKVLDSLIRVDVSLVQENLEEWTARWQREVVK